jgi:hypothetical protein
MLIIAAVDIIAILSYTRLVRTVLVLRVLVITISFGSYILFFLEFLELGLRLVLKKSF